MIGDNTYRRVGYVMTAGLIMLLCFFSYRAFCDSYLWMDEAGQFFMSKGLHHHSEKFASVGALKVLFENNSLHNLDPGGFTLILRLWSYISNHFIWLRLLPLIMYIGCLIVTFKLGWRLMDDKFLAVILVSILLLHPAYSINSCELRAYSMEMLGVALTLLIISKSSMEWNNKRLILLGFILSVFMTSRYSFVVFAFATILFVCYEMIWQNRLQLFFSHAVILGILPLITIVGIYILSLHTQMGVGEVDYVASQYIGSSSKALLSPSCLRGYLIAGIVIVGIKSKRKINPMIMLAFFVSIVFFIVSLLNLFPIDERRALSLSLAQCLALTVWLLDIVNKVSFRTAIEGIVVLSSVGIVLLWPKLTRNRERAIAEYKNFKDVVQTMKPDEKLVVCSYYDASVRYAIEYGDLKGKVNKGFYLNNILLGGTIKNDNKALNNITTINYYYRLKDVPQLKKRSPVEEKCKGIYVTKH